MATTKKLGNAGADGKATSEADGFGNPRYDEILTLLSRSLDKVIDRTFVSKVDESQLTPDMKERGVQIGDKLVEPVGDAKWQVKLVEVARNGRGEIVESAVGYADMVVSLQCRNIGRAGLPGGADERKLMVLCRPMIKSAAETLRTLKALKFRRNEPYGHDVGHRDEIWSVATDNDQLRDIFESNGFKYICTRWNDIDGWGRTDADPIKKVFGESGDAERWVLVSTDLGGISTTVVTGSKADAVTSFMQSVNMFAYAYDDFELRVAGDDMDGTLAGLRLLMRPREATEENRWLVPVQLCKGMGMEVDGKLGASAKDLAEGSFQTTATELTRLLRMTQENLDPAEQDRLSHSWAAMLFCRHAVAKSMAAEAGRAVKRKKAPSAAALALNDDLKTMTVWTTTTAMFQEGDQD